MTATNTNDYWMCLKHIILAIFSTMVAVTLWTQRTKSLVLVQVWDIQLPALAFQKQWTMICRLPITVQDLDRWLNTLQFQRKKQVLMWLPWQLLQPKYLFSRSWGDMPAGLRQRVLLPMKKPINRPILFYYLKPPLTKNSFW